MELVGERIGNLSNLSDYEVYFGEGDNGELRVYLQRPLYQDEIDKLENEICSQGVVLTAPITQDARILVIKFQKAIAPLLIIGGAIAAIVAGVTGWQIFRTTQMGVPLWVWGVGGIALLYLLFRKPARKAGGLAIQAGKVYVTRKALKNPRRKR